MGIYEHVVSFAGRPVVDWEPGIVIDDPASTIPRIRLSYDDADAGVLWVQRLSAFLETPGADQIPGLGLQPVSSKAHHCIADAARSQLWG